MDEYSEFGTDYSSDYGSDYSAELPAEPVSWDVEQEEIGVLNYEAESSFDASETAADNFDAYLNE